MELGGRVFILRAALMSLGGERLHNTDGVTGPR